MRSCAHKEARVYMTGSRGRAIIPPVYVTGGTLVFRSTMRVCASRAPVTDGSIHEFAFKCLAQKYRHNGGMAAVPTTSAGIIASS
jgi:hypothetical protein